MLLDGTDAPIRRLDRLGTTLAVLAQLVSVLWVAMLAVTLGRAFVARSITGPLVVLGGLVVLRALLRDLAATRAATVSDAVRRAQRTALAADIVRTPDRTRAADDATLLGAGIDALDDLVCRYRPARVVATVVPVVVTVVMAVLDPISMAILLFTGPMLIALLALVGARTRALADRRLVELGRLRAFHLDMVTGLPALRIFGRSVHGVERIGEASERFGRTTMDVLRTAFQTSLVIEWAATAATALVAVQVGLRLANGHLAFDAALLVLLLTPEFFVPLRNLAAEYHAGQTGAAALGALGAQADLRADHRSASGPTPSTPVTRFVPTAAPAIVLAGVTLVAPDSTHPLLDGADLEVRAGETVALIGPSGLGKTTVARAVLGLVSPTAGTILIDGHPLDALDPHLWRSAVTFVTQRPALVTGTIAENIAMSVPGASPDEIAHVAHLAGVDEFADRLAAGLHTVVGEGGLRLSGGQRQRIAIARALLRDAPVVVLDEFTAHLDPDTEGRVIEHMAAFLRDRTALVIAHRSASVELATRTITIVDGRFEGVPS